MRLHHSPGHWIVVAVVLIALLLILNEAHGQPPVPRTPVPQAMGAAGMFEGQPEIAGAQGGLGAQAGPPQGGIGVQGPQDAERPLHLRPPAVVASKQAASPSPPEIVPSTPARHHVAHRRERGYAHHGIVRHVRRAARHTVRQARTGTASIDSRAH